MMRHIVYLVPYLANTGPVNVLHGIVRHLDRTRFKATVVALMPTPQAVERERFVAVGAQVVELSYTNWQLQLHTKRIANEIQQRYAERTADEKVIFHAHGYYPTRILSKMRGVLTMTTIHNICDEDFRMNKGWLLGGYMSRRYKSALGRLDLCVTISDVMLTYYAKSAKAHYATVYNGVKTVPLPSDSERLAARRALGIADNVKVLLYPAAFLHRKNHKFLIDTIKQYDEANIVVLFAGSGKNEEACRNITKGDSRFRFLGFCSDMEPLWLAADFMVSPSLSEGLPMAVIEALMHGLPCILSDIPPHKEILQHVFGSDRLLFSLHEAGALARLLHTVLHEEFSCKDIAARAAKCYSSATMADGYMRMYEQM